MNAQGMLLRFTMVLMYLWTVSSFVLMESDSNDSNNREIEERVIYLINVLHKVKGFTRPEYTSSEKRYDESDLGKIESQDLDEWLRPADKSYERLIDIKKKDYSILPPSNEWCRIMGFRRCRSNRS